MRQGSTFALIGAVATAVHVSVALAAKSAVHTSPLWANFLGYSAAVGISYACNARFTFGRAVLDRAQLARFLTVSLAALLLGQVLVWLLVVRLGAPFWMGLATAVTAVPVFSFTLSRHWAFRGEGHPAAAAARLKRGGVLD
jgi:putative flippase GtrA